jgi:hypothetical protein
VRIGVRRRGDDSLQGGLAGSDVAINWRLRVLAVAAWQLAVTCELCVATGGCVQLINRRRGAGLSLRHIAGRNLMLGLYSHLALN